MNTLDKIKTGLIGLAVLIGVVIAFMYFVVIGICNDQDYQIMQSPTGEVSVIKDAGWYGKWFSTVWTYPRAVTKHFSRDPKVGSPDDESIKVTFNDGGEADISTMIMFQTPVSEDMRREAHRNFGGNIDNMTDSIRAHLINCIKTTGPLISASQNQSARKAEFRQLVEDQMSNGLYKMRKVEKVLKDRTDVEGSPILVYTTEIVLDKDNLPIVTQKSPLLKYGIKILQLSVTETKYDEKTLEQFATKKESFLAAELSKAQREKEVQERLMIEERGLREKAEVEAVALKEKAKAVINGEKEKEVAELEAAKKLAVAKLDKEEAETRAAKELAVAKLARESAVEQAAAIVALANAEEERIAKAGAITEKEQVLAEINAKMQVDVAEQLAKVNVPQFIIGGGGGGAGGDSTMEKLIQYKLLYGAGLLDNKSTPAAVAPVK